MPTLYEISVEAEHIADIMSRTHGDDALMTDDDRAAFAAFLDGLRTEAETKADGYARVIREYEARAKARREEASAMADMARADEERASSVKRFLMQCMERLDTRQLAGRTFTLAVQANGGKQPVDVFVEADRIPDRFVRVERKADRDALRDAILSGDEDAMRCASLMPRGFSLRIK